MTTTNGDARRKLPSWIEAFIQAAEPIEGPSLFKRWVAISTIAATLEQKVWIPTLPVMYPNLYIFLVAPPGVGKSRIINVGRDLVEFLPDPFIAPTSVTAASLIDAIKECKRQIMDPTGLSHEYNSMSVLVGEFGTFMSQYDENLLAILTDFFNVTPYSQRRRGDPKSGHLKILIPRPQLNMLIGTTPDNLIRFMPENAWGMGFASRIIFIYHDIKDIVDDFAPRPEILTTDLIHDLKIINSLIGQFDVTPAYQNAVNQWRNEMDENVPPKPTHPRLKYYNSRRKEQLYRLSAISAVDRGNALILDSADFIRAMGWLVEAEQYMPQVFESGGGVDASVMDEAFHLLLSSGPMGEGQLIRYIRKRVPAHAVAKILEVMIQSGMARVTETDRRGIRTLRAGELN